MKYEVDISALENIAHKQGCSNIYDISNKMHYDPYIVSNVFLNKQKPSSLFMYRFSEAFNVPSKCLGEIFFAHNLRDTQVSELKDKNI